MKYQCTNTCTKQRNRNRKPLCERFAACLLKVAAYQYRHQNSRTKHGKHMLYSKDQHFCFAKLTRIINTFFCLFHFSSNIIIFSTKTVKFCSPNLPNIIARNEDCSNIVLLFIKKDPTVLPLSTIAPQKHLMHFPPVH